MTIRHVVVFRWNDDVTDEHLAAMSAALDGLPGAIPEILVYRHGRDLGIGSTNFQYAVAADFASVGDFAVYRDHPAHQEFIGSYITGRVADRAAVQFEFTD